MKKIKKVIIVLAMMIAMVGFVNPMTVDASRTYKVTFRAGAHGTFAANGENKITIDVAANERFPDIPDINVEAVSYTHLELSQEYISSQVLFISCIVKCCLMSVHQSRFHLILLFVSKHF